MLMSRPLQEPTFFILTALAASPMHGYAITTDVAEISAGRVRLHPGTLYAALDRLRGEGLVDVSGEEVVETRLRRYYRLTEEGARRLADDVQRLRDNAAIASERLAVLGQE